MALVSVNGQDAIETRLTMPRTGAWHADVLVDDPVALAGEATINVNDSALVLAGTVMRAGVFADTGHVRIVAGSGGLGLSAKPRFYNGTSVRIVLGDLLAAAGETLSATADQSILSLGIDAWTTTATPIGTLISLLLSAAAGAGASWRVLPDGTLWVGRESWPDAVTAPDAYQILEDNAEQGTMRIGIDAPLALVGTLFEGRQVSATEAVVGQVGAGVEMTVWFEVGAPGPSDRLRRAFTALAQRAAARTDRIDYGRMYPATIVSQSGGTVDVQPDQVAGVALLPDMAGVRLWLPPGMSIDKTIGRVKIAWLGGDPSQPVALAFDDSSEAETMTIAVRAGLFLGGSIGAQPTAMMTAFLNALNAYLAPIAAAAALGAAMNPGGGAAAAAAVGTATTAWNQPALQAAFTTQKVSVT